MKSNYIYCIIFGLLSFSAFAQIKWNTGLNLAANTFGNNHPRIVLNRSGNPVVIWGRTNDASVFCSYWNGTSFNTPIKLNAQLSIATASWMGPDIASFGDTIYVVMKEIPEDQTNKVIYLVRSFDGAKTFSQPIRVDNIADSISRFPTITIDKKGNPIVAFMKFDQNFMSSRWAVCRSNDFGDSFEKDVLASGWGNSASICDCCPAVVVSNNDDCAVVYRDNNKNIRDSWMGVSKNNAETFIGGCNVDNNGWMIQQCPATGPDATIIGDTIYSVFMNGAKSNTSICYFSKSSMSNIKHVSTQSLKFNIPGLTGQNFPRISSFGNSVAIVWVQGINTKGQLPIILIKDIRQGLSTQYDTVDLLDITNADVSMNEKEVFVVWQDDISRTIKFRSGIYNTITKQDEIQEANYEIEVIPNPVSDQVKILTGIEEKADLEISDIKGKIKYKSSIQNSKALSIANWESGIYIIRIKTKTKSYFKRLAKY